MPNNLSDKDILSAGLLAVKHLTTMYNDAATQTDNAQLVQDLCDMIAEEHRARIALFETMRQRGWYNPQLIDDQQLRQAQQKLVQMSASIQQWSSTGAWQPTSSQWQHYQSTAGQQQTTTWQNQPQWSASESPGGTRTTQ